MKFINLTTTSGNEIAINLDYVIAFEFNGNNTTVTTREGKWCYVKENVASIMEKIITYTEGK